ncbi:MAG: hypothetical protein MI807_20760, partial [Verrucomicrobiales bacterium]|nr:hypothetical protein [Verrucomicrobiales bacterium]
DLVRDPGTPDRFYLSMEGVGIFSSVDSGATWTNISQVDPVLHQTITTGITVRRNIEMAVAPNGRMYAAVLRGGQPDYIGYTPDFTVGVWVGRFDNRPLNKISGATGAAPIFREVMLRLHRDREPVWYNQPDNAIALMVDELNGKLPPSSLTLPAHRLRREWFVNQSLPESALPDEYDAEGKSLLSSDYSGWWRSEANDLHDVAALSPVSENEVPPPFRIISPLEGTVAFLDPDLPGDGSRFPLRVAGSGEEKIEWSSPSLSIEAEGDRSWLVLKPGEHEVIARDQRTGREVTSRVKVEVL